MSYREHSFDPNAGFEEPRPLRPYDKWQWIGTASVGIAVAVGIASLFFDSGNNWLRLGQWSSGAGFILAIGGLLLIRYRREPTDNEPHPEYSEGRRRIVDLIIIAIGAAAVGYNLLESQGAQ